jgi:hypothetical protein
MELQQELLVVIRRRQQKLLVQIQGLLQEVVVIVVRQEQPQVQVKRGRLEYSSSPVSARPPRRFFSRRLFHPFLAFHGLWPCLSFMFFRLVSRSSFRESRHPPSGCVRTYASELRHLLPTIRQAVSQRQARCWTAWGQFPSFRPRFFGQSLVGASGCSLFLFPVSVKVSYWHG